MWTTMGTKKYICAGAACIDNINSMCRLAKNN